MPHQYNLAVALAANWEGLMLYRRDAMLRLGQIGLGAVTLPGLLRAERALAATRGTSGTIARSPASVRSLPGSSPTARSCILIYLWGGPPQQDMWDLKPDAPAGIRSQFKPIDTAVPGIRICDQMPRIARHTDKLTIVRALTHESNQHEVGVYHTLTGKIDNTLVVPRNQRSRRGFPNAGAVVSYFSAPGDMPASVTIPRPIGHSGVTYTGTYAGFLGPRYDPIELRPPAAVAEAAAHNFGLPPGVSDPRFTARVGLLRQIEAAERSLQTAQATAGADASRELAFRMLTSAQAKAAFRLEKEDPRLRDRYGRNEYGECFLLARRLIQAGVRLVTLTWYYVCPDGNVANVWDNHGGTGSLGGISGYAMLKEKYCIPPLDQGFSALLEDMTDRGLLDETLIAMFGEFGRTPKINANAGRDHWGACQSAIFAGGGIRGGQIHGSSDAHAAYPKSHPVRPEDVLATIYQSLGIPPESEVSDQAGRPYRVSEGRPVVELF